MPKQEGTHLLSAFLLERRKKMESQITISRFKLDMLIDALKRIERGVSSVDAGWKGEVREVQNLARLTLARFAAPDA